jgi:hypothetical protein
LMSQSPVITVLETAALLNLPGGERRGYNVRTAKIAHAS